MDIKAEVNKAVEYTKNKNYNAAKKIYLNILDNDENNAVILSMLGLLYLKMCRFKRAEQCLKKSYAIKPLPTTVEGLGLVYFYLNDEYKAMDYFEQIIDKTNNFEVFDKYIKILTEKQNYKFAYELSVKSHKMFPLKPEPLSNLVYSCINVGRLDDAYSYGVQLVKTFPKFGDGWIKFGIVNEVLCNNREVAGACYKKALALGEKFAANYNLSINASQNRDYKKAIYYLKKVYDLSNDKGAMNFSMASNYFKQRKFKKGYSYYINKNTKFEKNNIIYTLKRKWDGKTYKNETLLAFCDQGVGDCIMFLRYVPFLTKKFKKIKLLLRKPIQSLFARALKDYPNVEIVLLSEKLPRYDKSVILSDLPYYLKMWLDDIPYSEGYLSADDNLVKKYKEITDTDKYKIGICWEAGGVGLRDLLYRTLRVNMFEPFFNVEGTQFYSFQVKPTIKKKKNYKNLVDLGSGFGDFDDTAAALKNMDLLITVDTSVAHLAGALGVKTFMLLPYVTDWRWFDNDKKTEWYDSVEIFKQKSQTDWESVFEKVTGEIKKLVNKN